MVRYRAESLGDCCTYILRPHIFAGATMQNYMVGALRGTALGSSPRAARMRAAGKRLPLLLPSGQKYLEKRFQFVHVDDVARLLTYLLHRPATDPPMTILNVAAHGEPLTIQDCAEISQATVRRVPGRGVCRAILVCALEKRDLFRSSRGVAVPDRVLHHGHNPAARVSWEGLSAGDFAIPWKKRCATASRSQTKRSASWQFSAVTLISCLGTALKFRTCTASR